MTLKLPAEGASAEENMRDVIFNFQELMTHGLKLSKDADADEVREVLRKFLNLLEANSNG